MQKLSIFFLVTSFVATALASNAFRSSSTTGFCDTVNSESGYYDVSSTKHYFYWFFESRSAPSTDPLILWLTGGPGCSAELALFFENGPCAVNENLTTAINPYGWNSFANLLYVDSPVNTGFSYGLSYDHDEAGVASDLYTFLQDFFKAHPQFADREFYVFGESYGGHFVPAITSKIYNENKAGTYSKINLVGLAVGNGLTNPLVQYPQYPLYAINNPYQPIVTPEQFKKMNDSLPECLSYISNCENNNKDCDTAESFCNSNIFSAPLNGTLNQYDIRKPCVGGGLCYNFTAITDFLNLASTQKVLGVNRKWESCNLVVNKLFSGDWMAALEQTLPPMLADGIRVLIYAGEYDWACNFFGNKAWTLALDWPGNAGFNQAGDHPWVFEGKQAALARTYSNFTFMQVFDAGHLLPADVPDVALGMVSNFLNNVPFY